MQTDIPTPDAEKPDPAGYRALSSDEVAKLFAIASPSAMLDPVAPAFDVEALLTGRAAVVGTFTPQTLVRGLEPNARLNSALQVVLGRSVEVIQGDRRQWVLAPSARSETLAKLGDGARDVLASFKQNMGERVGAPDQLSNTLESLISGDVQNPEKLETSSLRALVNAAVWCAPEAGGADARLPQWRQLLEKRELLSPFERLLGDNFVGRDPDIKALRAHVDVVAPESTFEGWSRWLSHALRFGSQSILFIHGIGGVGKSTLMAKFIVEHAAALEERAFPFVYLDFDRASLDPLNAVTLLSETARQVGVQFSELAGDLESMRLSLQQASEHSRIEQRSRSSASSGSERVGNLGFAVKASHEFVYRISEHSIGSRPFLLVLDTFEEVQARGEQAVDAVFSWLGTMAELRGLKVVIAGRAPSTGQSNVKNWPLGNLSKAAALLLLAKEGLTAASAARIHERVGGNPLSLRLAARLVKAEGDLASLDLIESPSLFKSLDDVLVQGVLYTRLLKKIVDPDVQKLANPGLVLRRITPELIVEVLAPIVGLGAVDNAKARRLYDGLKNEATLVVEDAGSLMHRRDVREVMLSLQKKENLAQFESLNRAAVDYYCRMEGKLPEAPLELAYHRLMLGERPPDVLRQLPRAMAVKLVPGAAELPRDASIFLRAAFGKYLTRSEVNALPDEAWELYVFHRVRQLVDAGTPKRAATLLAERKIGVSMPLAQLAMASVSFNLLEWKRASNAFAMASQSSFDDEEMRSFALHSGELEVRPLIEHGFLLWFMHERKAINLFSEARSRAVRRAGNHQDDDPLMQIEAMIGYLISLHDNAMHEEEKAVANELAEWAESTPLAAWRANLSALRRMMFLGTPGINTYSAALTLFGLRIRSHAIARRFLVDCGVYLDVDLRRAFEEFLYSPVQSNSPNRLALPDEKLSELESRAVEALLSQLQQIHKPHLLFYLRGQFAPWRQALRTVILNMGKSSFHWLLEHRFESLITTAESATLVDFSDIVDLALDAAEDKGLVLELLGEVVRVTKGPASANAGLLLNALKRYTRNYYRADPA